MIMNLSINCLIQKILLPILVLILILLILTIISIVIKESIKNNQKEQYKSFNPKLIKQRIYEEQLKVEKIKRDGANGRNKFKKIRDKSIKRN